MKRLFALLFALSFALLSIPTLQASAEQEEVMLPILMYHSVSATKTGTYLISPHALEADLAELKKRGYVSVTLAQVKSYLKGYGTLPEKPVLITFDDGHYDNAYYALDILKRQGFTAVLHVIGCFTEYSSTHEKDQVEYSHLTWEEIGELSRSGVFEIGSHTYRMHAYKPRFGIRRKNGESSEEYEQNVKKDLALLEKKLLEKSGVIPLSFAYPFGAYDKESERIVKEAGYEMIFTCYGRINRLKRGDKEKLSHLNRINRDGDLETGDFLDKHKIL